MQPLVYAALVLGIDTVLAVTGRRLVWGDCDLFKLVFWLLVPLAYEWRRLDWGWYGLSRLKRGDLFLLLGIAALGVLALFAIPHFPGLRDTYPSRRGEAGYVLGQAIWILSWLPGWEFLHRYFVLRANETRWWVVIVLEGAYHLQKPLPEMLGMIALSAVLTYWTLRRRDGLPAFLSHLAIEAGLVAFLFLY